MRLAWVSKTLRFPAVLALSIVSLGVLVGGGILLATDAHAGKAVAWSQPAGEALTFPACMSASTAGMPTCDSDGTAHVTLQWQVDNIHDGTDYGLLCTRVSISGHPNGTVSGLPCTGSYTMWGLAPNTSYSFTVQGYAGSGGFGGFQSLETETVSVTTPTTCTSSLPDLVANVVNYVGMPAPIYEGSTPTLTTVIENEGAASTVRTAPTRFQVDIGSNGSIEGTYDGTEAPALASGGSATVTTANWGSVPAGQHLLRACADLSSYAPSGFIEESNENNNCGPWTSFTITPLNPVCVPNEGDSCNLNACGMGDGTIQCDGTCSKAAPSDSLCPATPSGTISLAPNPANVCPASDTTTAVTVTASANVNFSIWIDGPSTAAGGTLFATKAWNDSPANILTGDWVTNGMVFYLVDTATGATLDTATETLTHNGCSTLPDLTASNTSPTTATAGVATTLTATVSNATASTGAGFTNFFQLDTDTNHASGNETNAGTDSSPTLAAGGTDPISTTHTFATAGTYYVRACADKSSAGDVDGIIDESNEGNNCSPQWTTVTVTTGSGSPSLTCSRSPSTNTLPAPATVTYTAVPANGAAAPFTFRNALGTSLQSGSSLTYTTTYTIADDYAVTVGASNVSPAVACGTTLTVTDGSACGALTADISADPTRVTSGDTTHVSWSASGVGSSCVITANNATVRTVTAASCSIGSDTALTPDPTITEQTKYCISCDGATLGESGYDCVTVNVDDDDFGTF